jgi:pimeloyl-ACP methyl ester carboxylesterase
MTTGDPVRTRIPVNGIEMSCLEWTGPGDPGRCAVLLLHGILQNAAGMSGLARHLARYHRVVVPDLRGRGETDQPPDGYDPATMARDIADLVAALDLRRLVVIGRNHGGVVGYHFAADHPGLLCGLILSDANPDVGPERAARRLASVGELPRSFPDLDTAIRYYQERLGVSEDRARHDIPHDLAETGGVYTWRHNLDVIARIEAAAAPRTDWDILARIQAPTLLLRGQRSRIPKETAERARQVIPRVEIQMIFGAGHDVFLGNGAEQALGAIDMFLMRHNRIEAT